MSLSVIRPYRITLFPVGGFSWNFIFEYFSKICRENSSFIKIRQELRMLYMKTSIHFLIISHLFLHWEMFQTNFIEKIEAQILCSIIFLHRKSCRLWAKVKKCGTSGEATGGIMVYAHSVLGTLRYKHTLCQYIIFTPSPLQHLLHDSALVLLNMCFACLVYCKYHAEYASRLLGPMQHFLILSHAYGAHRIEIEWCLIWSNSCFRILASG